MKFYSEITKQNYDTVEALQEAEKQVQNQAVDKQTATVSDRKEAAKVVEKAFANASAKRKENAVKKEELDKKLREIDKKYRLEAAKLENEYREKSEELNKATEEKREAVEGQYREIEKLDKEALNEAYEELRKFCKKYGTYHYSVDAAGAELFPLLMGFGQIEKTQSVFASLLNSAFNLF